jgi:hypothetical protein
MFFSIILRSFILLSFTGCAYHFGPLRQSLPGDYKEVAIPVFDNRSQMVGIEVPFTNELIQQFQKSKVAEVVSRSDASVVLEGEIESVQFEPLGFVEGSGLPGNTVLTTQYRILVLIRLGLRKTADNQLLWSQVFKGERVYSAPQIKKEGFNSANPLYNHSAKHINIQAMAKTIMADAHDRIVERF